MIQKSSITTQCALSFKPNLETKQFELSPLFFLLLLFYIRKKETEEKKVFLFVCWMETPDHVASSSNRNLTPENEKKEEKERKKENDGADEKTRTPALFVRGHWLIVADFRTSRPVWPVSL